MPDDKENIPDGSDLLRRIAPDHLVNDQNLGRWRPTSQAFSGDRMSVDAVAVLEAHGLNWTFSLRNHPEHFLVRLNAGYVRVDLHQEVFLEPAPDQPDNPAHACISGRKTDSIRNKMATNAGWVKPPPPDKL